MTIRRVALIAAFALGVCTAPFTAEAQQAGSPAAPQMASPTAPQPGSAPEHIRTTQTFLKAWGNQRWDELRSTATDRVTVKVGSDVFTLDPAAQKSDVMLILPFRGMSTVRADGKVTGIKVEDMGLKVGGREMRGPGTINVKEEHGQFRITEVSAGSPQQ